MRPISLAACIIVIGVLAALPFRHSDRAIDPEVPVGIATGPLGKHLHDDPISGVMQWPDRPGFDPSIAWQPQPMRLEAASYEFEMPAMPDSFPHDTIEVPIPAPVRQRYDAVVNMRQAEPESGPSLVMPPVAKVDDRFVYTPAPSRPSTLNATVHAASVIRSEPADNPMQSPRQYIREPQ